MEEIAGSNWRVIVGDVINGLRTLPANSIHCCVTSPPYWGLRDYGVAGQLGQEPTPELFVSSMVAVFDEVRRVLRPDGTCWVNMGDSYAATGKNRTVAQATAKSGLTGGLGTQCASLKQQSKVVGGLKAKDLVGIPWRLALGLQASGWWLRDCIVWHKPNVMPESVRDRSSRAHEYIFMLAKSRKYYFDQVAISEKAVTGHNGSHFHKGKTGETQHRCSDKPRDDYETRNPRSVWAITLKSFKGAHFATFPPELPMKCILAGTSAVGCCPACGAPWKRLTEKTRVATRPGTDSKVNRASSQPGSPFEQHSGTVAGNRDPKRHITRVETTGWIQGCKCEPADPTRSKVLDPFSGSGTTGMVATELNCEYIGCELNPEYAAMTVKRIGSWKRFTETKTKLEKSARRKPAKVVPAQKSLFSQTLE